MSLSKQGACLCGATRLTVSLNNLHVDACHCSTCRKWGGGPALSVQCSTAPQIEGLPPTVYDSSEWAQRAFCSRCGTHLFYRLKATDSYSLPVDLLDGDEAWDFNLQIFIEEKPAWYCFANQTRELTGQQVFDEFSAPSKESP